MFSTTHTWWFMHLLECVPLCLKYSRCSLSVFQIDKWMNEIMNEGVNEWTQEWASRVSQSKDKTLIFAYLVQHKVDKNCSEDKSFTSALSSVVKLSPGCHKSDLIKIVGSQDSHYESKLHPHFRSLPQIQLSELFASVTEMQGHSVVVPDSLLTV